MRNSGAGQRGLQSWQRKLMIGTVTLAALTAAPVLSFAQTGSAEKDPAYTEDLLEEVIVTAQRREQSIQER